VKVNDYSLNPGRYIDIIEKEMSDVDFDIRMKELMNEFTSLTSESHEIEKKIMEDWKNI
jgi:type I restriction-modification system DNA methylase subunit